VSFKNDVEKLDLDIFLNDCYGVMTTLGSSVNL
jgi:hypothetical protein